MSGLEERFYVNRVDGRDLPGGDREGTRYFVLDPEHDIAARYALDEYAAQCDNPQLAEDIYNWLEQYVG